MQRKNVGFEQLSDIIAFRVLVDSMEECYRALGTLHARYPMIPGRFKDYISTPKPNGYKSLHTGVLGPQRQRIEVQIRTREMHEVAELGVAAHWQYKQQPSKTMDGRQYRWLRELLDILENAEHPDEFLEHTKLEMFQDQVFCFTPKGDLIALPSGSTPVDFAYAVHTAVGDHCVGAKVNGRMSPLRTVLHNGDQVEIVTSKAQKPSPEWERFVATGKARARIRRYIRAEHQAQYMTLGKQILEKVFRQEGYEFSEKGIAEVVPKFQAKTVDDLYALVGEGARSGREVVAAVYPGINMRPPTIPAVPTARVKRKGAKGDEAVSIKGLIPGMAVHFAGCCHPLPGDRIVGIVMTGRGVTIHTIDCDTLAQYADEPERWLDLSWGDDADEGGHVGRLSVVVANTMGSLSDLTTVIAKNHGNISNLKIVNRSADFFEMLIDIEVRDVKHLSNVIAALRASKAISSVERTRG